MAFLMTSLVPSLVVHGFNRRESKPPVRLTRAVGGVGRRLSILESQREPNQTVPAVPNARPERKSCTLWRSSSLGDKIGVFAIVAPPRVLSAPEKGAQGVDYLPRCRFFIAVRSAAVPAVPPPATASQGQYFLRKGLSFLLQNFFIEEAALRFAAIL